MGLERVGAVVNVVDGCAGLTTYYLDGIEWLNFIWNDNPGGIQLMLFRIPRDRHPGCNRTSGRTEYHACL